MAGVEGLIGDQSAPPTGTSPSIGLLGPLVLSAGEDAALPVKSRALLAYLAAHAGQPIGRDRLADLLWERSGQDQARQSLRQALSSLRRVVPALTITATPEHVAVTAEVDSARFQALAGMPQPARWEEALAMWRGPFLDGLDLDAPAFASWATQERQRLDGIRAELLSRVAEQKLAAGEAATAVEVAKDLVRHDVLWEDGHRLLIRALSAAGRRAEAFAQYDALAANLPPNWA